MNHIPGSRFFVVVTSACALAAAALLPARPSLNVARAKGRPETALRVLAPVGYSRLMHPEGEIAAARAAGEAGTGYILSTISGHKLEDVKAGTKGFAWYQLYLAGGRPAAEGAMDRARFPCPARHGR